jgi:putative endonuclease
MSYQRFLGKWGEDTAANYLIERGLVIVGRNWRSPYGEIDLIAKENEIYVFVEVKTRGSDQFGFPETAVTWKKREHLIKSTLSYLTENKIDENWRIDVISIRKLRGNKSEIEWFQNAIKENQ